MSLVDEHGDWETKKISLFGAVRSFVSSLKLGQDMTRVPMPACFFRPYSILEVLAHRTLQFADLLNEAALHPHPEERLLKLALWHCAMVRQEAEQV
jgi:hypothetical protein